MKTFILKICICTLALTIAGIGSAGAATTVQRGTHTENASPITSHSKSFNFSRTWFLPHAHACVTLTVWGKLSWRKFTGSQGGRMDVFMDRKVENPTMSLKSWTGPRCRTKQANKPLRGASLSEVWYEQKCGNGGLDISASIPWGVTIGTTLSCTGNGVHRATRKDTFHSRSSTYRLNNTGSAPRLSDLTVPRGQKACTAVDVAAKIPVDRNDTDTVDTTFHVCAH